MSSISDVEIDLEKLFLPAWAQESPSANRYARFAGEPAARDDRERRERPEPPPPLPEITVTFLPDEHGVESLARQIKMTGRAFPLFQIAQIVLAKPERYSVQLGVKKKPDGT